MSGVPRDQWKIDRAYRGRSSTDHPDARIAGLAARQGGVVGRAQLLVEIGEDAIDRRLRTGHLRPVRFGEDVLRGVYCVGGAELTHSGRRWAAYLAAGDDGCLAARAAADIQGLLASTRLELIVPRGVRRKLPPTISVRRVDLDPADVEEHDDLRLTRWPRTCLDIAAVGTPKELRLALDRTVTLRRFDRGAIEAVLDRYPKAHGAPELRRALDAMTDDGARSEPGLEEDLFELVLGAVAAGRLPRPEVNALVEGGYVGDLVWRAERVIVEADGARWHDGPFARERDHERQTLLEAAGWLVLRVRWPDVHRHPDRTLARIARALDDRTRRRA